MAYFLTSPFCKGLLRARWTNLCDIPLHWVFITNRPGWGDVDRMSVWTLLLCRCLVVVGFARRQGCVDLLVNLDGSLVVLFVGCFCSESFWYPLPLRCLCACRFFLWSAILFHIGLDGQLHTWFVRSVDPDVLGSTTCKHFLILLFCVNSWDFVGWWPRCSLRLVSHE